jgi:hypothetical protein
MYIDILCAGSFVYGTRFTAIQELDKENTHYSKSLVYELDHVEVGTPRRDYGQALAEPSNDVRSQQTSTTMAVQRPLKTLPYIPPVYMDLLDHFLAKISRSLSCHKGFHRDLCSVIVPMALETPHLLASVLLVSANHRVTLGLEQSLLQIEHLRATTLRQLRGSLMSPGTASSETAMATTLMLCFGEIVSGGDNTEMWRVHLQGAGAIWKSADKSGMRTLTWDLLERLYRSIEVIASSYGMCSTEDGLLIVNKPTEHYIDDLSGFSTALLPTFDEINNLMSTSQRSPNIAGGTVDVDSFTEETCRILIERVEDLLSKREPKFAPRVENTLSPLVQFDFFTLDEAYHHMALLQLYCIASRPFPAERIQNSVATIIACINKMSFVDEPCPSVAVLPPLFIAGCHASICNDRKEIVSLLHKSEIFYGMGNVKSARKILNQIWGIRDTLEEEEGGLGAKKWRDIVGKNVFLTS